MILANGLVLGCLLYAALLVELDPDQYYRLVQEDEPLEWSSFWLFVAAGAAYAGNAMRRRREAALFPWLHFGISAFCLFVAFEEISWGQRLLGYRPPPYFLEHNFQQELNLHNIVDDGLRQLAFTALVLGYGVLLPLLVLAPALRRLAAKAGFDAPPLALAPAFLATAVVYEAYPWSHTGEWAEMMFGAALLFAALWHLHRDGPAGSWPSRSPLWRAIAAAWLLCLVLGAGTATAWWRLASGGEERIAVARVEVEALRIDLAKARNRTRCNTHKRLYSLVEKYALANLHEGEFAGLVSRGLPDDRAAFFLDPWNSPYWVRHICSEDRSERAIFVYSFGPNRLRDSTRWQIEDDDVGAYISRAAPATEDR